jgi:hypothetical protein
MEVKRMKNNNKAFEMPCITTVSPGAVPVITTLCRTAKIGEMVNQMVQWDEDKSKISPGLLIESLIVCIFCGRKPLWRVEEFWSSATRSQTVKSLRTSNGFPLFGELIV